EARHRLGDKAAAAADVEQAEPGEGSRGGGIATEMPDEAIAQEGESHRVHAVQRLQLPFEIPPGVRERGEARDFAAVDRAEGRGRVGRNRLPPCRPAHLISASPAARASAAPLAAPCLPEDGKSMDTRLSIG